MKECCRKCLIHFYRHTACKPPVALRTCFCSSASYAREAGECECYVSHNSYFLRTWKVYTLVHIPSSSPFVTAFWNEIFTFKYIKVGFTRTSFRSIPRCLRRLIWYPLLDQEFNNIPQLFIGESIFAPVHYILLTKKYSYFY